MHMKPNSRRNRAYKNKEATLLSKIKKRKGGKKSKSALGTLGKALHFCICSRVILMSTFRTAKYDILS